MTQAGYSGTPLARKLGIKPGLRFALHDPEYDFVPALFGLPDGVEFAQPGDPDVDVLLYFARELADLAAGFAQYAPTLVPAGMFWVAWPKKSSGEPTDITENALRDLLLPTGWVDTKVCAIDATWSGLRFVRRKANR